MSKRRLTTDYYLMHGSHKYIKKEMKNGKMRYYYDYNDGNGKWSNKAGVEISTNGNTRTTTFFNTKNTKYWDKHGESRTIKIGPITIEDAEDGRSITISSKIKKTKVSNLNKRSISRGSRFVSRLLGMK